jgi:hypothetical protein
MAQVDVMFISSALIAYGAQLNLLSNVENDADTKEQMICASEGCKDYALNLLDQCGLELIKC